MNNMGLKKVVLIDDSNAVNQMNLALLKKMNVTDEVQSFQSAMEAFAYLQDQKEENYPEILFVDLQMPEVDGFSFLDKLEEHFEEKDINPEMVIVFLSSHLNHENFSKTKYYRNLGDINHIKKPMDKLDITNLIEEHFE